MSTISKEDLLIGNELIAKFVGYQKETGYQYNFYGIAKPKGATTHLYIPNARYHTSWDWLRPVIDKIKEVWQSDKIDVQLLCEDEEACKIKHLTVWASIETTWQCVLSFINWYNNQQQ